MSNATQPSHNSGERRRRRSRGGNNRNRNQDKRHDEHRGSRDFRGSNSNRSEEFRPQGPRPPRGHVPVKLTWWQKLLKAIGLYKAPSQPTRKPQTPNPERAQGEARAPKSNTRNARTNEGGAPQEKSGDRPPKKEGRGKDRERKNDRPRGGDRSTVESPRVYVGNLSYDVTEQDLQELFKGVGPVRNVEIVYNRTTHRSKGYGFVEMLHMDEAIRAVEVLNDQFFMGRKMTVSGAKSKGQDERDDNDEQPEREAKPVTLAPLPAVVETPAANGEETGEPVIQTIVEETTAAEAAPVVEAAPATEEPTIAVITEETTVEATEEQATEESATAPAEEAKTGVA